MTLPNLRGIMQKGRKLTLRPFFIINSVARLSPGAPYSAAAPC